ncbi:MAG: SEL1-like repeat protein [Archangium sp.]|nr:SEL1-like repeat protein [Archangium sp.]
MTLLHTPNVEDASRTHAVSLLEDACNRNFDLACVELVNTTCSRADCKALGRDTKNQHNRPERWAHSGLLQSACTGRPWIVCTSTSRREPQLSGTVMSQACSPHFAASCLDFLEAACGVDDSEACERLAYIYEKGDGVTADPARAVGFYRQSCRLGHRGHCAKVEELTPRKKKR